MVTATIEQFRELLPLPNGDNELVVHYHDGHRQADNATERIICLLWGPQSGKTCYGPHWLHKEITMCGPGDYLAVSSTYDLFKLKLLPELKYVFCDILNIGKWWAGDRIIELAEDLIPGKFKAKQVTDNMWGRIILRSADSKSGLESATCQAAWLDEAGQDEFRQEAWDGVLRRLSLSQGRILITTTLYNWGWLKQEVYDRWRDGDDNIRVIQLDSLVNPVFPREEYERARRTLPPWKFDLFYRGIYTRPAGLIYDSFDDAVCKIKRFPVPDEWMRYVGHDFGSVNMVAGFYAVDPATSYAYLYRTYKDGNKSVGEHVRDLKALLNPGEHILRRVGGSHQEDGWREAFTQAGWPIQEPRVFQSHPHDATEIAISRVYELHRLNKLFIFSDLSDYLNEKYSYSRELDEFNNPTEEIKDDHKYHFMAQERYILSEFTPEMAQKVKASIRSRKTATF